MRYRKKSTLSRKHTLRLLAAALMAVVLATPASAQISVPPQPDVGSAGRYLEPSFSFTKTQADVPYGQAVNSRGELQTLTLDVFEPSDDPEEFRPAVLWVHGGYFSFGSKSDVDYLHDLTRRGYVTVPINYRIRPEQEVSVPELIERPALLQAFIETVREATHDALAAIRWVRANAAELRVDPGRVIIAGHSAGGHTTLNVVFNHEDDCQAYSGFFCTQGNSGNPGWPSRPAAGLADGGSYGSGITGRPPLPGDAPILVMHGALDTVAPMATTTAPCAQTLIAGNVCEMRIYPTSGHSLPGADRGLTSTNFLYRNVISAARIPTEISDVATASRGETVTVTGRLTTDQGAAVAGARILGRATSGWAETTTDADGGFVLDVGAPDHGRSAGVKLRYEGRYVVDSGTPHAVAPTPLAPTHSVVTATWGSGPQ